MAEKRMQLPESFRVFLRSLPRSAVLFLAAVSFNVVAMVGYAVVLLTTGLNASAFYLAAVMLSAC